MTLVQYDEKQLQFIKVCFKEKMKVIIGRRILHDIRMYLIADLLLFPCAFIISPFTFCLYSCFRLFLHAVKSFFV